MPYKCLSAVRLRVIKSVVKRETAQTYSYVENDGKPLYPFGYGLSYTEFEYSDIEIGRRDGVFSVSFTVKNVGKCAGAEVAQVYVGDVECSVLRPAKELKGFEKVYLKPGESRRLNVCLGDML